MSGSPTPHDVPDMLTVRDYVEILRRHGRLVVGVALLVVLVAVIATTFTRTTYTANVELLVQPPAEGDVVERALLGTTDLATQQRIITSRPIVERVARQLDLSTDPTALRELADRMGVSVITDTSVMSLTAQHEDPELAAQLPQAFADQYIAYQRDVADERVEAASNELEQLEQQVRSDIDAINEQLGDATDEEVDALRAQREQLATRREAIADQMVQLDVSDDLLFTGQVIAPAATPQERSLLRAFVRNIVLGLVFGLALGAALAFVREWLQDRLVRPADVARNTGAPILAWTPGQGRGLPLGLSEPADGDLLEAYRALRATVQAATMSPYGGDPSAAPPSVLVTGADPDAPSGAVAANLAVAFARSGLRVLLADAQPTGGASTLIEATIAMGLYVLVDAEDGQALPDCSGANGTTLHVVGPGASDGVARDRLTEPRVRRLLKELGGMVDLVVFDAGPAVQTPEAVAIGPAVSEVVLVARWQATRRTDLQDAAQRVRDVGGRVMGTVLCPAEDRDA